MGRMSTIREFSMFVLIVSVSLLVIQNVFANPNIPLNLLSPVLEHPNQASDQIAQRQLEPFINRIGKVSLGSLDMFRNELVASQNASSKRINFKGMHFLMTLFPELEVTVIVDSEVRSADNIISMGGHQIDSDMSTFSMTITRDNFLITYQDLVNAVTYRVVGDVETGLGKVVEIDLKKLPPRYDSEPVIPPEK